MQCFVSKNKLTEHKEVCLSLNGAQSVRLEKGTVKFKNYFKQIPVPFKIYADFECNLKSLQSYEGFNSKKYQDHISCSFAYKLFFFMINLLSQKLFLEARILLMNLLAQFLKSLNTVKK